jgi:NAD(P)-dependent dehydrogenase (short-subunit alcohol dehydrogenase family)
MAARARLLFSQLTGMRPLYLARGVGRGWALALRRAVAAVVIAMGLSALGKALPAAAILMGAGACQRRMAQSMLSCLQAWLQHCQRPLILWRTRSGQLPRRRMQTIPMLDRVRVTGARGGVTSMAAAMAAAAAAERVLVVCGQGVEAGRRRMPEMVLPQGSTTRMDPRECRAHCRQGRVVAAGRAT